MKSRTVIPKWLIWTIIIISLVGILDSTYLTVGHYTGESVLCPINSACDDVLTSEYSAILGIPLALLGVIFYFSVFVSSVLYLDTRKEKIFKLIILLSVIGFLSSLYFVYLQLFVIGVICFYCMISAIGSTIIFLLSFYVLKLIYKQRLKY